MNELVARTNAALRKIPVIGRATPTLATAWHEVDRTHALYQTRRLAWGLRHGRSHFPLTVGFTPEAPRYFHSAYRLCVRLGADVVPVTDADVTIHWSDVTVRADPPPGLDPKTINLGVRDISKRHVNRLHLQVFGYGLDADPGATAFVEKSDGNAMHDGRIVDRPSGTAGMVTQHLIDNRLDDHLVADHRVAVMDGRIVMSAVRYRAVDDRFLQGSANVFAALHAPDAYFSATEQAQMAALCAAMGADWAELDVLRDRVSGRLYVVDVNPTASGPVSKLVATELAAYWRLQADGFADLLRAHATGRRPHHTDAGTGKNEREAS